MSHLPLRRRRGRHTTDLGRIASRVWWHAVVAGRTCLVCGARRDLEGHHVISRQALRRRGLADPAVLWDARNGIPLCRRHHARHETRVEPVPRRLLPQAALDFAEELNLTWILEKRYP